MVVTVASLRSSQNGGGGPAGDLWKPSQATSAVRKIDGCPGRLLETYGGPSRRLEPLEGCWRLRRAGQVSTGLPVWLDLHKSPGTFESPADSWILAETLGPRIEGC